MTQVTFNVDKKLADAIGQAISDRTKEVGDGIRQGDILITLMSVAKGLIESHSLPSHVKAVIVHTCVAKLTEQGRGSVKFTSGHRFPEGGLKQ